MDQLLAPFLNWPGGKRRLLPEILSRFPDDVNWYGEPFLGGGAVLFGFSPMSGVVGDVNGELINTYECVRDRCDELVSELRTHVNSPEHFYKVRSLDRSPDYRNLDDVVKAARIIYLNKTCFNGLFRVNSSGFFNVSFGNRKNPNIVNEDGLRAVSDYLNNSSIKLVHDDYQNVMKEAPEGGFVYLDPPYDSLPEKASFTAYTKQRFDRENQMRLKKECDELNYRGVRFLLSNASTDFIKDQYSQYKIEEIEAPRSISAYKNSPKIVKEVLVSNF